MGDMGIGAGTCDLRAKRVECKGRGGAFGRPLGYLGTMPTFRHVALALVTCSSAAFAIACGGDDVAAVPDASDTDVTAQDTGANDTGTDDTGTGTDTGTTDGGTDAPATPGLLCVPTSCTSGKEACCAPKGGTTDTCKALPDGGPFQRVCASNESEFRCSTSDACGANNSRCCARRPKISLGDGGAEYTSTCTTQGCATSNQSFALTLCTPNGKIGCGDAGT